MRNLILFFEFNRVWILEDVFVVDIIHVYIPSMNFHT